MNLCHFLTKTENPCAERPEMVKCGPIELTDHHHLLNTPQSTQVFNINQPQKWSKPISKYIPINSKCLLNGQLIQKKDQIKTKSWAPDDPWSRESGTTIKCSKVYNNLTVSATRNRRKSVTCRLKALGVAGWARRVYWWKLRTFGHFVKSLLTMAYATILLQPFNQTLIS